jgi:hypothetical protein
MHSDIKYLIILQYNLPLYISNNGSTTLYLIGDIKIYKNILILSKLSNLYNIF